MNSEAIFSNMDSNPYGYQIGNDSVSSLHINYLFIKGILSMIKYMVYHIY